MFSNPKQQNTHIKEREIGDNNDIWVIIQKYITSTIIKIHCSPLLLTKSFFISQKANKQEEDQVTIQGSDIDDGKA